MPKYIFQGCLRKDSIYLIIQDRSHLTGIDIEIIDIFNVDPIMFDYNNTKRYMYGCYYIYLYTFNLNAWRRCSWEFRIVTKSTSI